MVMLSAIVALVCLRVSISSVSALAVPAAPSNAQKLNLASLVLAGQVNLTSRPSFIGDPPEELGAFAWHCFKEQGHQLKTQDVAQAFRKIPVNPAPMVFTKTPAAGEGAVKVPVEFVGMHVFRTRILRTLFLYTDGFASGLCSCRRNRVRCHDQRRALRCGVLDPDSGCSRPAPPTLQGRLRIPMGWCRGEHR